MATNTTDKPGGPARPALHPNQANTHPLATGMSYGLWRAQSIKDQPHVKYEDGEPGTQWRNRAIWNKRDSYGWKSA
jgi:hypothetical protein